MKKRAISTEKKSLPHVRFELTIPALLLFCISVSTYKDNALPDCANAALTVMTISMCCTFLLAKLLQINKQLI